MSELDNYGIHVRMSGGGPYWKNKRVWHRWIDPHDCTESGCVLAFPPPWNLDPDTHHPFCQYLRHDDICSCAEGRVDR